MVFNFSSKYLALVFTTPQCPASVVPIWSPQSFQACWYLAITVLIWSCALWRRVWTQNHCNVISLVHQWVVMCRSCMQGVARLTLLMPIMSFLLSPGVTDVTMKSIYCETLLLRARCNLNFSLVRRAADQLFVHIHLQMRHKAYFLASACDYYLRVVVLEIDTHVPRKSLLEVSLRPLQKALFNPILGQVQRPYSHPTSILIVSFFFGHLASCEIYYQSFTCRHIRCFLVLVPHAKSNLSCFYLTSF